MGMLPGTPREIHHARGGILLFARAVAASLVVLGLYLFLKRVLFGVLSGPGLAQMMRTWDNVGEEHSFYRGVAMIAVGTALGVLSDQLARWIVPVRPYACPACGYGPATGEEVNRCSECGLGERIAD